MSDYPVPNFHFQVEWGGTKIGFTEVSGLNFETQVIEYRHGASPEYFPRKQPGQQKWGNITLKRGTFNSDNEFYNWWRETIFFQEGESTGSMFRRDITLSILNENHEPIIVWKVKNAWPTKLQTTDLVATSEGIAIETIELVHEGLVVQND